ncbi:MAG TPA: SpoIIE family protein phosphatase [Frankiaceae bacterium]|nr:SpoIIE family protein phosphatase [Frankiaceae bacterium]
MVYDVSTLGLSDLVRLTAALRTPPDVATMEDAARFVVRYLYDNLVDKATGDPACVLVRCYKTQRYGQLPAEVQEFAAGLGADETTRCLALLASAGVEDAWNDRRGSVGHRAIPLVTEAMVARSPMIHELLVQMGLDMGELVAPTGLLVDPEPRSYNVFHVAEALGSPFVPAQADFVEPYGVRSVVGFGGLLPDGEMFAVVLFSRTPITRDIAERFRAVTGSVGLALLPYSHCVFVGCDPLEVPAEALATWRAASLEQLLQVREVAVLEQSLRIEQAVADLEDRASELARSRMVLLESEARKSAILEAALDAIVTIASDGRVVEFNGAAERMFGYSAHDAIGRAMAHLIVPPRLRAQHYAGMARHLATGEARILGQRVEIDAQRADGSEFPVELAVTRIDVGGPPMFTAHVRDITEVRRAREELRELADTLQAGLLPPRPPKIPGVEVEAYYLAGGAGVRVGGDFYDVFRLGPEEWGVIIGDVCGKGAKAASVTALVRHTARAAAAHSTDPGVVMREMNAALAEDDAEDRYCSAVFARLCVGEGEVAVHSCCGGHPSPLLVRANGVVEAVAPWGGQLIGLFEEYEASCDEYTLRGNDILLLYTDGVTEARDAAGELFGQDRLAALAGQCAGKTAEELVDSVRRALAEWTDQPNDDVAMVALRPYVPRPPR